MIISQFYDFLMEIFCVAGINFVDFFVEYYRGGKKQRTSGKDRQKKAAPRKGGGLGKEGGKGLQTLAQGGQLIGIPDGIQQVQGVLGIGVGAGAKGIAGPVHQHFQQGVGRLDPGMAGGEVGIH